MYFVFSLFLLLSGSTEKMTPPYRLHKSSSVSLTDGSFLVIVGRDGGDSLILTYDSFDHSCSDSYPRLLCIFNVCTWVVFLYKD